MNRKEIKYSIGLDIGTNSVGWAIIDQTGKVIKYNGRLLLGSRLFNSAETAQARRLNRSARRHYIRRRVRIHLLRDLLGDMVNTSFYKLLDENSFLTPEDSGYQYNLFNDKDFTDVDFYKQYPTIYHLRKELYENPERKDPRLVYLALHHIIKYRGNFLYEGQKLEFKNVDVKGILKEVLESYFCEYLEITNDVSDDLIEKLEEIMKDHTRTNKDKANEMTKVTLLEYSSNKGLKQTFTELYNSFLGLSVNLKKLFYKIEGINELADKDCKIKFSDNYEEKSEDIEAILGDDYEYIEAMLKVYNWYVLNKITGGTNAEFLSDANCQLYDVHKNDLKQLKKVIREDYPKVYNKIFNSINEKGNYVSYIHNSYVKKSVMRDEFYKYIKNILEKSDDLSEDAKDILQKIELDIFMPKQTSVDNAAIPYQFNLQELNRIIDLQGQYYPILLENKDKIISLLEFRIPYHVGPLHKNATNGWMVRKAEGKIYPWNFEEMVDVDQSAEIFITRMTNHCTMLYAEDVLPRQSLTYSMYVLLNEINKMKIDDKKMNYTLKKMLISDLFMKKKKVTVKDIQNWAFNQQLFLVDSSEKIKVEGMGGNDYVLANLESWIFFTKLFGEINESNYDEIEKIIRWMTVYEDKKVLARRLKKELHLSDEIIKKICAKKFKGWGRLSEKLLKGIRSKKNGYGDSKTIMDLLNETNLNLNGILAAKEYNFTEQINTINADDLGTKLNYATISEIPCSPKNRRGIWQSILIIKELIHFMKHEPENIYVEMAREEGKKERTKSQIKSLVEKYNQMVEDGVINKKDSVYQSLMELSKQKDAALDSQKLLLYYLQNGKCMYSGKNLEISELSTYEVDHIVPRSLVKDNSIDNLVLVIKKENQRKTDYLKLSEDIIKARRSWWSVLKKYQLISDKKYYRLVNGVSDGEQRGFIARQLVETRQISKDVINLLSNGYPNVNVCAIRAGLSHDFREQFDLYKARSINDFHHAHDAYLAALIGNYIYRKYPNLQEDLIYGEYLKFRKNVSNSKDKFGFILNGMRNIAADEETGEIYWNPDTYIAYIKDVFYNQLCYVSKKLEMSNGSFFDLTIIPSQKNGQVKNRNGDIIPVNKYRKDVLTYGGFIKINKSHLMAIEYTKKKELVRKVIPVYIYMAKCRDEEILAAYLEKEKDAKNGKIIKSKIMLNQLIEVEGGLYTLASDSEWNNARQMLLPYECHKLFSLIDSNKLYKMEHEELISIIDHFYKIFVEKLMKYYPKFQSYAQKFKDLESQFDAMSLEDKINTVKQMIVITQANPSRVDIKDESFYIGTSLGRLNGKNVDLNKTVFYDVSVTGLYCKKYKL